MIHRVFIVASMAGSVATSLASSPASANVLIAPHDIGNVIYFASIAPPEGVHYPSLAVLFSEYYVTRDMSAGIKGRTDLLPPSFHAALDSFGWEFGVIPNMVPVPLPNFPLGLDRLRDGLHVYDKVCSAAAEYVEALEATTGLSFELTIGSGLSVGTVDTSFYQSSIAGSPPYDHVISYGTISTDLREVPVTISVVPEPSGMMGLAGLFGGAVAGRRGRRPGSGRKEKAE